MGLQTDNGNVFTLSSAISKQIKLELPDWSQMKDLLKSLLLILKFNMTIFPSKVRLFY